MKRVSHIYSHSQELSHLTEKPGREEGIRCVLLEELTRAQKEGQLANSFLTENWTLSPCYRCDGMRILGSLLTHGIVLGNEPPVCRHPLIQFSSDTAYFEVVPDPTG